MIIPLYAFSIIFNEGISRAHTILPELFKNGMVYLLESEVRA